MSFIGRLCEVPRPIPPAPYAAPSVRPCPTPLGRLRSRKVAARMSKCFPPRVVIDAAGLQNAFAMILASAFRFASSFSIGRGSKTLNPVSRPSN